MNGRSEAVAETIYAHLKVARKAAHYAVAQRALSDALAALGGVAGDERVDLERAIWMDYSVIAAYHDDLRTAIVYNELLAAVDPHNPTSHLELARLYGLVGDSESSAIWLRRGTALAEALDHKVALTMLASRGSLPEDSEKRAGRIADAIAVCRHALEGFALEAQPEGVAAIQTALGHLCLRWAELLTGAEVIRALEEARSAFRQVLAIRTQEASPVEHDRLIEQIEEIQRRLGERTA